MVSRPDGAPEAVGNAIQSWGIGAKDGDAMLRVGGIAMGGVDGGFEGARMREPYAEPYGQGGTYRGLQTVPQDRFTEIVKAVNRLGDWTVFTDAIGDAAIDQVLVAYEAANAERSIVGRRWGIEHAFIPAPDQFPKMAATVGMGSNSNLLSAPCAVCDQTATPSTSSSESSAGS